MTIADPTANERAMVEVRALRMLRAGDSIKDVTQATGLTAEEIGKLNRDFPSTAPATARRQPPPLQAVPAASRPDLSTIGVERDPSGAMGAPPVLTIARLLEEASVHSNSGIRALGKTIEDKLDNLRARIKDQAAEEQARQQAAADRAKAKADVERLEQQLAEARAKLRGPAKTKKAASGRSSSWTPEMRTAASERLKARRAREAAEQATTPTSPATTADSTPTRN